eukprot:SAG31_NODE_9411_length_1282_cov_1.409975_1_plen_113_part_10
MSLDSATDRVPLSRLLLPCPGMLDYEEFTDFLLRKKRQRDKKRMTELETRLLTFCQEGTPCGLKVTPRHWKRLLSEEVQKRLTDNIDLIEQVRSYFLVFVPTIREMRDFYREM